MKLSRLAFTGCYGNGLNIDHGGRNDTPSHHIVLESLTIRDTGTRANHDAIKLAGVDHFLVTGCHIEGWGGSGVDLVGCHFGVIEKSKFMGTEGARTKNAVQVKGGSHHVLVQKCYFRDAGERVISIGGQTGLPYFRPADAPFEASDVIVAGNRFVGGEAPIAWVTSRDSHVHHNIFFRPGKWVGRIQQETKEPRFKPCQGGLFESNIIWSENPLGSAFNVGGGTDPASFAFRSNAWHLAAGSGKPSLPTRETDGVYRVDFALSDPGTEAMQVVSEDPRLKSIGPAAYQAWKSPSPFADVRLPAVAQVAPPRPVFFKRSTERYYPSALTQGAE